MAKKRGDGGGSNMVLILFLVFFILATVILGVTTYMGYSEVDNARGEASKAKENVKTLDDEVKWYRFQARVYREYIGVPMVKDEDKESLANDKAQFDQNPETFAKKVPGVDDVKTFLGKMKTTMRWNAPGDKSPSSTYETRLQEKDKQYAALARKLAQVEADRNKALDDVKAREGDLEAAKKEFDTQVAKMGKEATATREQYKKDLEKLRDDYIQANKDKNQSMLARSQAEADRKKTDDQLLKEKRTKEQLLGQNKRLTEDYDRVNEERRALAEKVGGVDLEALQAERLDREALEELKKWRKNWQIVAPDRKGVSPYINLGSADGLKPLVTFSVHTAGLNGKLVEKPKATVEVVRVIGPHLSQVRITSIRDAKADPVVKGDRLFNPTWDPSRSKHVAIAGLVEMGGEGLDSSEDFRRLLARQNAKVDAYIDTKGKAPKVVGDITSKTEYLILADSLEGVKHDKRGDKEFSRAFDKQMRDLKEKAQSNGVTIIPLRRYLDMIGYQPPRALSSTSR